MNLIVKLFLDKGKESYTSLFCSNSVHVNIQSAQNNTFLSIFLRNDIRPVSYFELGAI